MGAGAFHSLEGQERPSRVPSEQRPDEGGEPYSHLLEEPSRQEAQQEQRPWVGTCLRDRGHPGGRGGRAECTRSGRIRRER